MPVYRTPDGKIVEEKTVKEDATENQAMPPPPDGGDAEPGGMGAGFDAPTQRLTDEPDVPPPPPASESEADKAESKNEKKAKDAEPEKAKDEAPDEDERTRLVGARLKSKTKADEDAATAPSW